MMKAKITACASMMFVAGLADAAPATLDATDARAAPPSHGVHWARGAQPAQVAAATRRSPLMTYHGGKVMPTASTFAIYKGTSWGTYSGD